MQLYNRLIYYLHTIYCTMYNIDMSDVKTRTYKYLDNCIVIFL